MNHNTILGGKKKKIQGGREGKGNKKKVRKIGFDKSGPKDCTTGCGIYPINCIILLNCLCLVPIWSTFTRLHKRAFQNAKWITALTSLNPSIASYYPQNNIQAP